MSVSSSRSAYNNSIAGSSTDGSITRKNSQWKIQQRRRDKRRHDANAADLRDPLKIIAIAVRFDEALAIAKDYDESILTIPLETGRLYNQTLFTAALAHLDKRTAAPTTASTNTISSSPTRSTKARSLGHASSSTLKKKQHQHQRQHDKKQQTTDDSETAETVHSIDAHPQHEAKTPLTPIILSGLLANLDSGSTYSLQHNEEEGGEHRRRGNAPHHSQRQLQQQDLMHDPPLPLTPNLTSTELVAYCNQMRRAALGRVRLRKERQNVQRIVTPVLVILATVFLYFYTMAIVRNVIDEYGFAHESCEQEAAGAADNGTTRGVMAVQGYAMACRIAAADVWEHLHGTSRLYRLPGAGKAAKQYVGRITPPLTTAALHQLQQQVLYFTSVGDSGGPSCTIEECFHGTIPLYTMHTQLYDDIVPLETIQGNRYRSSSTTYSSSLSSSSKDENRNHNKRLPIQWLGESTVNKQVREALVWATSTTATGAGKFPPMKLLDVGSGLSGTLFSLLTREFPFSFHDDFVYHGISVSQPEVQRAKQLVEVHKISAPSPISSSSSSDVPKHINVTLSQASFDDQLPEKFYTAMVAIESLSFSRNLNETLKNLARSLKSSSGSSTSSRGSAGSGRDDSTGGWGSGVLIIVDDVVQPWASTNRIHLLNNATAKHSLLTHKEWRTSLDAAGLTVRLVRDLGMEYDAPFLFSSSLGNKPVESKAGRPMRSWYDVASDFLEHWKRRSGGTIAVLQDLILNARANSERQEGYHHADLGYYLYVCTKN